MKDLTALIDRNGKGRIEVEFMLEAFSCRIYLGQSLEELQALSEKTSCRVLILDLDLVAVHNRFIRSLMSGNPDFHILATSSCPFNPELKEAMTYNICAYFRKPLEAEEIEFWLKSVTSNAPNARDPTDDIQA